MYFSDHLGGGGGAAAAPAMGIVEAAVLGLQEGKGDMITFWRGELFPTEK